VADGDRAFLETLRAALESDARVEIVGAAASASELLDLVDILAPDIALVDVDLYPHGATSAIEDIGRLGSSTPVLVLVHDEAQSDLWHARPSGAAGYLRKDTGVDGLRESFFEVASLVGAFAGGPPRRDR